VVATLSGFYHDFINANLEVTPYLLFEAIPHKSLICSPCFSVRTTFLPSKTSKGSDECGGGLVHLSEGCLVISRVGIQETQELTPSPEIHDLVNTGKGK
jgi:hypothetical protein